MRAPPNLMLESEPPDDGRPVLRFVLPEHGGTVGSADGNAVRLPEGSVRRLHARIIFSDGLPVAFRLHADARLAVNDLETDMAVLRSDDIVRFGDAPPLRVRVEGASAREETPDSSLWHLCAVTNAIDAARPIDDVLAHLTDAAMAITKADRGFIVLVRDGHLDFGRLRIRRRENAVWNPATFSRSTVEEALHAGLPVLQSFGSLLADRPMSAELSGIGSALACALKTPNGPVGVLYLDSHRDHGVFAARDGQMLRLLSNIAAVAVAQADGAQALATTDGHLEVARRLVDFSPNVLFALDGVEVVYENPSATRGPMAGIAGRVAEALLRPEGPPEPDAPSFADPTATAVAEVIRTTRHAPEAQRERITVRLRGQERVLEVRTHRIGRSETPALAVSLEDVTCGHEAEQLLIRAERVASAEALASGMAHDFNNLLTVLRSGLEYMADTPEVDPAQGELLGEMQAAVEQARELTQRLLRFARRNEGALAATRVSPLLEEVVELARRSFRGRNTLVLHDLSAGSAARVDRTDLQRALLNLLLNARDASTLGQEIELWARVVPLTPGGPAGALQLSVVDHGAGISRESAAHLFEPFFTTKGPELGTGLGLASSRRIARRHGGDLEYAPTPGGGATFALTLPLLSVSGPS